MILYDIDSDEIIHILNFDYKIDVNLSGGPLNATRHEMRNISFDVGEVACDYIRDWYLETLKQTNGKLRYASESLSKACSGSNSSHLGVSYLGIGKRKKSLSISSITFFLVSV